MVKPKGHASHFDRDAQNPLGFGIAIEVVQIRGAGHAKPPPKAISSANRLVPSAIYSQCHSSRVPVAIRALPDLCLGIVSEGLGGLLIFPPGSLRSPA